MYLTMRETGQMVSESKPKKKTLIETSRNKRNKIGVRASQTLRKNEKGTDARF